MPLLLAPCSCAAPGGRGWQGGEERASPESSSLARVLTSPGHWVATPRAPRDLGLRGEGKGGCRRCCFVAGARAALVRRPRRTCCTRLCGGRAPIYTPRHRARGTKAWRRALHGSELSSVFQHWSEHNTILPTSAHSVSVQVRHRHGAALPHRIASRRAAASSPQTPLRAVECRDADTGSVCVACLPGDPTHKHTPHLTNTALLAHHQACYSSL